MSNKFLGLDSINVLKDYIDKQILEKSSNSGIINIHAYRYSTTVPETPIGGGFSNEGVAFEYPTDWNSLVNVVNSLDNLDEALSNGSIWMTAGVSIRNNEFEWSTPVKISGQNGVSVKFRYTNSNNSLSDEEIETLNEHPSGVSYDNKYEYVYTKVDGGNWEGPFLWAVYSKNATNILWRYKVTATDEIPSRPTSNDSSWSSSIPTTNLSGDYPYMWMSTMIVPANEDGTYNTDLDAWSEPILFGHYGQDGSVPDYTFTLYAVGSVTEAPIKPEFQESENTSDFKSRVEDVWKTLPEETGDVWYQCTIEVNGINNYITNIGEVKRYSAVDGTALPGQFTKYLYKWSNTQESPDFEIEDNEWKPTDWNESPDADVIDNPEASLWMISAVIDGYDTDTAIPIIGNGWSTPVKITGPRGPISYDYRVETRYEKGTRENPRYLPTQQEWGATPPYIDGDYPYIWAMPYLVCYKMKYADTPNDDGTYPIVQDSILEAAPIDTNGYYRLTGLNGENGNKNNSVNYIDSLNSIEVNSFSSNNYYISNSAEDVNYNIKLETWAFINGSTAKFANIGTGNVIITSTKTDIMFNASCIEKSSFTLLPNETVEIICYTNLDKQQFIVIGKQFEQDIIE